ncbi:hypothetical protein [Streptomyces alboniger]|uniref:hypothetical protein n=1 Tax=Streptomyces alboniger TaxID=132473 RepID=UPI0006E40119|nr:hypothetical protein [Streptomyces alboniger]
MCGAIASTGFVFALVLWHDPIERAIGAEPYKALLQFFLVAVLGGGVSLVYQALNREADRRAERIRQQEERTEALRETRRDYLRDLVAHYNATKRARRLLRATALTGGPGDAHRRVRLARYDELLQAILDAQLALETMSRIMGAHSGVLGADRGPAESLDTASDYLRLLITEYEDCMPVAAGPEAELSSLPELADFIGPYAESSRFRHEFIRPMQAAMSALEQLVVGPAVN